MTQTINPSAATDHRRVIPVAEPGYVARRPKVRRKDLYHQRSVNLRWELALSALGLTVTLSAAGLLAWDIWTIARPALQAGNIRVLIEQAVFSTVVGLLIYGNVVYQLARWGYHHRLRAYRPAPRRRLDALHDDPHAPALTVLVPSYKEQASVVWQTLLSAALQDYPDKQVVLLIDDPPQPRCEQDWYALEAARRLPRQVQELLREPAQRLEQACFSFELRLEAGELNLRAESTRLSLQLELTAEWFERQADAYPVRDATDALFVSLTFLDPASDCRRRAAAWRRAAAVGEPDPMSMRREYRRLARSFRVTLTSFERKRYANLSHEPNKAMNLNSYIGLLGRNWRQVERAEGVHLVPAEDGPSDLKVPPADFLITLDADSLLAHDYAPRLVDVMLQPGNERIAVAQTPYTATPDPAGVLERVAGATTDMQYNVHQGFTKFNATYWVGANALLRVSALRDIATEQDENGLKVQSFIADRTVIEDTESSVDLATRGWRLFNYPRRLSYSATPADFGSLLVQRRRWANGGLIILPKLLRHLFGQPGRGRRLPEGLMRIHYLISIAAVNLAVPILLLYPFEDNLRNLWLPLTAVFYFYLYGRDMTQVGYKWSDLVRVYALNLMLIPVNLGGVFKSIEQGITGRKIPFKRTPKVAGRTGAPLGYVLLPPALAAYSLVNAAVDLAMGRWLHALFAAVNGALLVYASARFLESRPPRRRAALRPWRLEPQPVPAPLRQAGWPSCCQSLSR